MFSLDLIFVYKIFICINSSWLETPYNIKSDKLGVTFGSIQVMSVIIIVNGVTFGSIHVIDRYYSNKLNWPSEIFSSFTSNILLNIPHERRLHIIWHQDIAIPLGTPRMFRNWSGITSKACYTCGNPEVQKYGVIFLIINWLRDLILQHPMVVRKANII
jgi:hypothetical protein